MKKLAILGSTGSIGTQTLDVVRSRPEEFGVAVLAAYGNDVLLEEQIREFQPEVAVLVEDAAAKRLRARYTGSTEILSGEAALEEAACHASAALVVTSLMGFAGLKPTLAAIDSGKDIALANKETLVVAGALVMRNAAEKGVNILPVDSEHSALFQCLQGEERKSVEKLWLTASGGPFRGYEAAALSSVSVEDCLKHPTWSMGRKITVDSATLVNKGLEVIEAHWLYGVPYEKIEVVVHPESIVHSMIEFTDGALMAQLGSADMRLPIQYALTYPQRKAANWKRLDFRTISALHFESPRSDVFRGLPLAYAAGRAGGTMPCVFNAANEVAVEAFLQGELSFTGIYEWIERTMEARENKGNECLSAEALFEEDAWARAYAKSLGKK